MAEDASSVVSGREVDTALRRAGDGLYTAVVYRVTLDKIDESDVLFGTPYIGQSVRVGTPKQVANARWKQEIYQAAHEYKQEGFIAALDWYGEDAFTWEVLCWVRKPRYEAREWANAVEIEEIHVHGGKLRDMNPLKRIDQTFNQTKGGSGNRWESIDAFRTKRWRIFEKEIVAYVAEHQTAFVPQPYVNPDTGYKLGKHVADVRAGRLLTGHPEENKRRLWLESLPSWHWNAFGTQEHHDMCVLRNKVRFDNESEEQREQRRASLKEAQNRPEVKEKCSVSTKATWDNASPETYRKYCDAIREASNRPETKEKHRINMEAQWNNLTPEGYTQRIANMSEAQNRPDVLENNRKKGKEWAAREKAKDPEIFEKRARDGLLRPDVRAKKQLTYEAKRARRDEEMRETLSPDEYYTWKRQQEWIRRKNEKKMADMDLIRELSNRVKSNNILHYRRDGTLSAALVYNDVLNDMLSELAVECLV